MPKLHHGTENSLNWSHKAICLPHETYVLNHHYCRTTKCRVL